MEGKNMYRNELEIDVLRCMKALYKRKWLILLVTILFLIVGVALTLDVGVNRYSAKATVYAASNGSYSESANAVNAMNAYLNVANSYKVCQRAALLMGRSDVDASMIQRAINVSSSANTGKNATTNFMNSSATILIFNATTTDSQLSMEIADAMAQSYAIEMKNILNSDSVRVLDNAYTSWMSYNAKRNAWETRAKYALVGLALSCFVILAGELFDRRVRTIREATIRDNLPIIGIIPDSKD
jgi:capsular polysaccharide biosynthesis protein